MLDVLIVGGGVVGASIARQLSRYKLRITLVEKASQIALEIKNHHSALVHSDFTQPHTLLKTRLSFQGRAEFPRLSKELGFTYNQIGSYILARDEEEIQMLHGFLSNGERIGLDDVELWTTAQLLTHHPQAYPRAKSALYCKGTGLCSPRELTQALMRHAVDNGVELALNQTVNRIERQPEGYKVFTAQGQCYTTRYLVNAAGPQSKQINRLAGGLTPPSSPHSPPLIEMTNTPPPLGPISFTLARDHNQALSPWSTRDFIVEQACNMPHYVIIANTQFGGVTTGPAIAHRITGLLADAGLPLQPNPEYQACLRNHPPSNHVLRDENPPHVTPLPVPRQDLIWYDKKRPKSKSPAILIPFASLGPLKNPEDNSEDMC